MAVYRVIIKKRVQRHEWSNTYTIASRQSYTHSELLEVADQVTPRLVQFEQYLHIRDVQFYDTLTSLIRPEPGGNEFAQRSTPGNGLRDISLDQSWTTGVTLLVGFQPVSGYWGSKDYRYSIARSDVRSNFATYVLRDEARQQLAATLTVAKSHLQPLLLATLDQLSLAVSANREEHEPMSYQTRLIKDIQIKDVHFNKPRRK